PAEIHDLFPDRRHGRRHLGHDGAVRRLDPARRRRRRRQILRAGAWRLHDLRRDDRRADPAPARAVRAGQRMSEAASAARRLLGRRARIRPAEWLFWTLAVAALFLLPGRHLILNSIAVQALFALSYDLVLGYAGIVSLGHAAF